MPDFVSVLRANGFEPPYLTLLKVPDLHASAAQVILECNLNAESLAEIRATRHVAIVSEKVDFEATPTSTPYTIFVKQGTPDKSGIQQLVEVVRRLMGPGGCPWDIEQTHESLKRYLLEESYELFDAIDSDASEKIKEELGDVLLQPLMHAEIKRKEGKFDIDEVAQATAEKLIYRHPHVFGDVTVEDADEVLRNWDQLKKTEKGKEASVLGGVPRAMPALLRAYEVSKRAARSGFEWQDIDGVLLKMKEEIDEVLESLAEGDVKATASEIGDLLFTVVNFARWLKIDPEEALQQMVSRFTTRFQTMETAAQKPLRELTFEEWDNLWETAKVQNRLK